MFNTNASSMFITAAYVHSVIYLKFEVSLLSE